MTKTTAAELGIATVAELRDLAAQFQARINADANDTAAGYHLARIDAELSRRQRLCRAEHPATHAACALLVDHGSFHHALVGDRW